MFALLPLLTALMGGAAQSAPAVDPFAFFAPTVVLTADERRQLDSGAPIARILPADGREVAVLAVVPVQADGDRVAAWIRRIDALKRSDAVPAIGRFSSPPVLADLATLTLDPDDATALRACRPTKCDLKLTPPEIARASQALAAAGPNWRPAADVVFREIVLSRAQAYLAPGAGPSAWPAEVVARLVQHSPFLTARVPAQAADLARAPAARTAGAESFLYWAKEKIGGKATISISDVALVRGSGAGDPVVMSLGRQIFASHYLDASLGVTALVQHGGTGRRYLVYVNRSQVDVLGGMFGGMVRWAAERRVRNEASRVLDGLRRRIDSGAPPR